MENNSLIKSSQDIEAIRKMSNEELEKYAENKAKEILSSIQQSCNKVKNAKKEAEVAKAMKIRFWERSKAKTDAVAFAFLKTNEAVGELANLQKEAITFTCASVEFAHVMHQTMARMMAVGFRDANGNIRELDENTQQFAKHILDEAERFVKNQKAVENELNKQGEAINAVSKIAEDNRRRLAEKDDLDKKQEECIAANRKSIDANHEAIHLTRTQISVIKAMSIIAMISSIFSLLLSTVAVGLVFIKQ